MFKHYNIDGNKEMVAIGTMNVIGSCFSCYLTTGKSHFLSFLSFEVHSASNLLIMALVLTCFQGHSLDQLLTSMRDVKQQCRTL